MTCEPNQPVDPCEEPCPLEKIPRGFLAEKATQIINDNIDKLNCILCPDTSGPEATDDAEVTPFGTPVVIDVLGDDLPGDFPIDPAATAITSPPANGTVVVNPDGTIEYTPNPGTYGVDTFTYCIFDTEGNKATAEVTVTIEVEPPVATPHVDETPFDTPITLDVVADDIPGDLPIDPTQTAITGNPPPASQGTVSVDPVTGEITFTPAPGFSGPVDQFSYCIFDTAGNKATTTVDITVGPDTSLEANPDGPETGTVGSTIPVNLLGNDVDPEGGTITITTVDGQDITAGPVTKANGLVVTLNAAGDGVEVVGDTEGTFTCDYETIDSDGDTAASTFTVVVEPCICSLVLGEPSLPNVNTGIWEIPITSAMLADECGEVCIQTKETCEVDQSLSDWADTGATTITHAGGVKLLEGVVNSPTDSLNNLTGSLAGFFVAGSDTLGGSVLRIDKLSWAKANGYFINEDPFGITNEPNTYDASAHLAAHPTSAVQPIDQVSGTLVDIVVKICDEEVILKARNDVSHDNSYTDAVHNAIPGANGGLTNIVGTAYRFPMGGIDEIDDTNDTASAFGTTGGVVAYSPVNTLDTYMVIDCELKEAPYTPPAGQVNGQWTPPTGILWTAGDPYLAMNNASGITLGIGVSNAGTDVVDHQATWVRTTQSPCRIGRKLLFRNADTGDFVSYDQNILMGY